MADISQNLGEATVGADITDILPWGELNRGKAITQSWLTRHLKEFEVYAGKVGPEDKRLTGYKIKFFDDAFSRYISPYTPRKSGQPDNTNETIDLDENKSRQPDSGCPVSKSANPLNSDELASCPGLHPPKGEIYGNGPENPGKGSPDVAPAPESRTMKERSFWHEQLGP